jgi:hypothetical protein
MTTLTRWTRLTLVALGALALGACAQPGSSVGAGTPSAPANSGAVGPSPTTTLPPPPVSTLSPGAPHPPATGCQANLTVTVTDNGATLCVHLGGTVTAELQGAPDQMWRPIALTGDALTASTGAAPPIIGATTSRYSAAKAGSAGMSSTRPACPPAKPGSVSCNSLQYFHVTVIVQ